MQTSDDPGVFDVTVSIEVTRQMSSNATLNVFNRRQLQGPKNVAIIYNQTSSYKTTEPEKYDDVYVATTPFVTRQGDEDYIKALRKLSPYYDDITSVGLVRTNPADAPVLGGQRSLTMGMVERMTIALYILLWVPSEGEPSSSRHWC